MWAWMCGCGWLCGCGCVGVAGCVGVDVWVWLGVWVWMCEGNQKKNLTLTGNRENGSSGPSLKHLLPTRIA